MSHDNMAMRLALESQTPQTYASKGGDIVPGTPSRRTGRGHSQVIGAQDGDQQRSGGLGAQDGSVTRTDDDSAADGKTGGTAQSDRRGDSTGAAEMADEKANKVMNADEVDGMAQSKRKIASSGMHEARLEDGPLPSSTHQPPSSNTEPDDQDVAMEETHRGTDSFADPADRLRAQQHRTDDLLEGIEVGGPAEANRPGPGPREQPTSQAETTSLGPARSEASASEPSMGAVPDEDQGQHTSLASSFDRPRKRARTASYATSVKQTGSSKAVAPANETTTIAFLADGKRTSPGRKKDPRMLLDLGVDESQPIVCAALSRDDAGPRPRKDGSLTTTNEYIVPATPSEQTTSGKPATPASVTRFSGPSYRQLGRTAQTPGPDSAAAKSAKDREVAETLIDPKGMESTEDQLEETLPCAPTRPVADPHPAKDAVKPNLFTESGGPGPNLQSELLKRTVKRTYAEKRRNAVVSSDDETEKDGHAGDDDQRAEDKEMEGARRSGPPAVVTATTAGKGAGRTRKQQKATIPRDVAKSIDKEVKAIAAAISGGLPVQKSRLRQRAPQTRAEPQQRRDKVTQKAHPVAKRKQPEISNRSDENDSEDGSEPENETESEDGALPRLPASKSSPAKATVKARMTVVQTQGKANKSRNRKELLSEATAVAVLTAPPSRKRGRLSVSAATTPNAAEVRPAAELQAKRAVSDKATGVRRSANHKQAIAHAAEQEALAPERQRVDVPGRAASAGLDRPSHHTATEPSVSPVRSSRYFANHVFVLSRGSEPEKASMTALIKALGGDVAEAWHHIYGRGSASNPPGILRLQRQYTSTTAAFVLLMPTSGQKSPDNPGCTSKMLYAIAIGCPVLSSRYVADAAAGAHYPWSRYLVAAGRSVHANEVLSQVIIGDWASQTGIPVEPGPGDGHIKLLQYATVLYIGATETNYPEILTALGAQVTSRSSIKIAKGLPETDYVLVEKEAAKAIGYFAGEIVTPDWLKECLINKRIMPVEERPAKAKIEEQETPSKKKPRRSA